MKIKLYKSVALCSLLALAGCHDFEELNTNPYAPITTRLWRMYRPME